MSYDLKKKKASHTIWGELVGNYIYIFKSLLAWKPKFLRVLTPEYNYKCHVESLNQK